MGEPSELGVLVVHGIGGQRRGDTLLDIGEPLITTLVDWLGADAVELRDTELAQASPGQPAHLRLTIRRDGEVKRVLVAESWWADTFYPPGWWAFARWLVWAVPFVIFRAADHGISVIDTNDKLDDARHSRTVRGWALALWYVVVRLLKNVVSVALVLVAVVVLALGGIVGLVPRLHVAILSAQRLLIRYVGDSYCLLTSPVRAEATISEVERDLDWLERKTAGKVAILAHSQGAELVRRVIERRTAPRPISALITFGSGIAKLRAVERLYGSKWTALAAYLLRVLAAGLTVAWPVLALTSETSDAVGAAALPVAALLYTLVRKMLRNIVQSEGLAGELKRLAPGKVDRWHDFYATSDPVPEGPLPVADLPLEAASSMRIANYRSPIRDHTSYGANGEAFRPAVLAELARLVGWTPSPPAMVVVNNARERRARAALRLVFDRVVIGGLLIAAVVLRAFDLARDTTDDVERWLAQAAGWVAGLFDADAERWLEDPSRRDLVAGAALVVGALALYGIAAWFWSLVAQWRTRRMFGRPPGAEPLGETTGVLRRFAYGRIARHADKVDADHGWAEHPTRLRWLAPRLRGGFVLFGLRYRLRQYNLYDTAAADPPPDVRFDARTLRRRADGTGVDITDPSMGAARTHFGRNGPAFPQRADDPPAARISEELLRRRDFLPAGKLNLLAACWLQFEVHDWLQHRPRRHWHNPPGGVLAPGTPPLKRTDLSRAAAPRFISDQTHWWDASQLYGVNPRFTAALRAGDGRVKTGRELLEAIECFLFDTPAPVPNFWLGLAVFHEIFACEHNAICHELEDKEGLAGDALFEKARLVNAAVMAKIHTVEWTPAVIAHPTTAHAILATWWGVLREPTRKRLGRFGRGEVLSGIPGSRTHHDGVRYSLTEEFVGVYRMHPLIPDEVAFHDVKTRDALCTFRFDQLAVAAGPADQPRQRLCKVGGTANAIYSLAIGNPGRITLHNYPDFLRNLPLHGGGSLDLARRDIERTREAALPRYNDFRRVFRRRPVCDFEELTGDAALAADLAAVYKSVEDVDLMVGLFAEPVPKGFAFSDTAFRVFLLMAARRLRSDRFFTSDFTPAVYTRTGYRWVQKRTMKRLLFEHFPELGPVLPDDNVFTPWCERP